MYFIKAFKSIFKDIGIMGRKPHNVITEKPPPKKRGRKPKGGKIIKNSDCKNAHTADIKTNIILHLKHVNHSVYTDEPRFLNLNKIQKNVELNEINLKVNNEKKNNVNPKDTSTQLLWEKIRQLKISLHKNDIGNKRSSCFWCTYDFDNPPIYIPKQQLKNDTTEVYGCFCSPECAVAFLKNESLDTSVLWERYSLINNIYSSIYNYEKNIQPAPNPYYTLNKYYGNLTIEEYRSLLNKQQYLIVVDKPLTKVMPELYEEITDEPNIYTNLLTQKTDKDLRLSRNTRPAIKSLF